MHSLDPVAQYYLYIYPLFFVAGLIVGTSVLAFAIVAWLHKTDGQLFLSIYTTAMTVTLALMGGVLALIPVRFHIEHHDASGIILYVVGILAGGVAVFIARKKLINLLREIFPKNNETSAE